MSCVGYDPSPRPLHSEEVVTDWLYRLAEHPAFPSPLAEISALAALDDEGAATFLMLQKRQDAPGKSAERGVRFLLCTRAAPNSEWRIHAEAIVAGPAARSSTPASVMGVYGEQPERWFVPLENVIPVEAYPVPLSSDELAIFLGGRATARKLTSVGLEPPGRSGGRSGSAGSATTIPNVLRARYPADSAGPFSVLGVDPTAADWSSAMTVGAKKPMPSVRLSWTGSEIRFGGVAWHTKNDELWRRLQSESCESICIDGPCATNGLRIKSDWSGWDPDACGGTRDAEVALANRGVALFWTTHATVTRFAGAREWIARSLRLFDEAHRAGVSAIETHPHGAFSLLWRTVSKRALPKKTTKEGRAARLSILRAFVSSLEDSDLRDHDAVDAAMAALIAVLNRLGGTTAFGTVAGGGQIWMPADAVALTSDD